MNAARLLLNLLTVLVAGVALPALHPRVHRRDQLSGALAAAVVLIILLSLRAIGGIPGLAGLPSLPGTTWILVVVAVEESAKVLTVQHQCRLAQTSTTRSLVPVGIAVGLGFAAVEHLLYLLSPTTTIVLRLLTAGVLHTATAAMYAWGFQQGARTARPSQRPGRRPPSPLLPALLWLIAVATHSSYNLIARSLDQTLIFW